MNSDLTNVALSANALNLNNDEEMCRLLDSLLASTEPLDDLQCEQLKMLIVEYSLSNQTKIARLDTAMLVIDSLVEIGNEEEACFIFKSPCDVLRYLCFKQSGKLYRTMPRVLLKQDANFKKRIVVEGEAKDAKSQKAEVETMKALLEIKYDSALCHRVAIWMNSLPISAEEGAREMLQHRSVWARVIRSLRLSLYASRHSMNHFADMLDIFNHINMVLESLKQYPLHFVRSLYAALRVDTQVMFDALEEVADQLPQDEINSLINAVRRAEAGEKLGMRS